MTRKFFFTVLAAFALTVTGLLVGMRVNADGWDTVRPGDRSYEVSQTQYVLASYGYAVPVTGFYGPITYMAVLHWQRANGLLVDGIVGPQTAGSMGLTESAVSAAGATRLGGQEQVTPSPAPPPPSQTFNAPCPEWHGLLVQHNPGWNVEHMARIMYRESRCQPGVTSRTGCCRGLLQIHSIHLPNLGPCGVSSRDDLFDPSKNVCAASIVYQRAGGMSPWAL